MRKKYLLVVSLIVCAFLVPTFLKAQQKGNQSNSSSHLNWSVEPFDHKLFILNKGQFDAVLGNNQHVLYGVQLGKIWAYFTTTGVIYRYDELPAGEKDPDEKLESKPITHILNATWENASSTVTLEAADKQSYFYSYPSTKRGETIKTDIFKKLTYHNLYPGIDVEYTFPDNGTAIKYAIIVHPGADYTKAKIDFSGGSEMKLLTSGDLVVSTAGMGDFTDNAPVTYIDETKEKLESSFSINGNQEAFSIKGNYDKTKTVVIDPIWNVSPGFTTNNAYDLDYDNRDNVYAYGSYSPFQLVKINSAGVIQWTFNTVNIGTFYYGDVAVDKGSGTSYLVAGWTNSVDPILKVGTNGTLILTDYHDSVSDEMWRAVWDPCDHQVAIGGGGGSAYQAFVLDTTCNTTLKSLNPISAVLCCHDAELVTIDPYGKSFFLGLCRSNVDPTLAPNALLKMPLPAYTPTLFNVNDGYTFQELAGLYGGSGVYNGMNGLAASPIWLYSFDGATLKRWNKTTGALSTSLVITGTSFQWGGLDVDWCDNLYVGEQSSVQIYNSALSLSSTIALPNTVYDVVLNNASDSLFVCGKGYVQCYTATPPAVPTISKTKSIPGCSCNSTAKAELMLCGNPDTNVTYLWSNGQTTQTATGLCPGVYTVTISFSCTEKFTDTVTIFGGGGGLTLTATATPSTCAGNTGTASVTVAGGTSPYTYLWSNGQTSSNATGLSSGSYCVTVTDKNGCNDTACVNVGNTGGLTVTTGPIVNVSCNGGANGTCGSGVSGGTTPYTYSWSNGQTTSNASGMSAGTYTLTVTDANGCTATATAIITQPTALVATLGAPTNVTCNGGTNGSINVTGSGGTAPYSYSWSNGSTSATATGLSAGSYTITLTDNNGCSVTASATLTQPTAIISTTSSVATSCGTNNGSATVTPAGGTGTYTYLWTPSGQTNATATGLSAGTYNVTITDANGCTATASVIVSSTGTLAANITASVNITCYNGKNGSITVTASGGTPAYTYLWTPSGQTTSTATGLSAGTYTITVTDANGCIASTFTTLTEPTQLRDSITSITNVACAGQNTGAATVGVKGGTPVYTYAWTPSGGAAANATGLSAGTYTITITDANGCSVSSSATITQPAGMKLTAAAFPTTCNGGSDGQATVIPTGGATPYTYLWAPTGQTAANANNLSAGTYTVTVTDANGCPHDTSLIVTQPLPIVVSFLADTTSGCYPLCFNFKDGTTDPNGTIKKWNWNFGDGGTDTLQNPRHCYAAPGTYNVSLTVTDNNGCTASLTTNNMITVYDHPHTDFSLSPQPANILEPTISFTDLSTDTYGIVSWLWNFNDPTDTKTSTQQNPQHVYGDTGIFCPVLTVTNTHGCVDSITHCLIIVDQYTLFIPDAFTPNGDGRDDIFLPKGAGIVSYNMYIFDRWGMMIFHSNSLQNGWDGSIHGNICQEDTYVYLIQVLDNEGQNHSYIGKVSLLK